MTDLKAMIQTMRERHQRVAARGGCKHCYAPWPCDSTKLADALEVAMEALRGDGNYLAGVFAKIEEVLRG